MNYLGVDWGEKRIGLALADGETKIATPFKTAGSVDEVARLVASERIDTVILGRPSSIKNYDPPAGRAGLRITNEKYNKFIENLKKEINVPIELVDERLSSKAADALVGTIKTKASRDEIAAMIILQDYLDKTNIWKKPIISKP